MSGSVGIVQAQRAVFEQPFRFRSGAEIPRFELMYETYGKLNAARVPAWGLLIQGIWAAALVLPRTYDPQTQQYGNLYSNLLDYVVSAALLFYILTIAGVFRLRRLRPGAERPYRAFGYPVVPALYMLIARDHRRTARRDEYLAEAA